MEYHLLLDNSHLQIQDKSHLHYKLGEKKCVELLIVDGKASDIKELMRRFQTSGEVENIKLIRT